MELSDEHIKAIVKNMAEEMAVEMQAASVKNAGEYTVEKFITESKKHKGASFSAAEFKYAFGLDMRELNELLRRKVIEEKRKNNGTIEYVVI